MPWRILTAEEIRLTPAEKATLQNIQGATNVCADLLTNVIGEFRDTIAAVGTALGAEGTVPDMLRPHVIHRTRWLWLTEFPQLKAMATPERSKLNDEASTMLNRIAAREIKVPPGDGSVIDQTVLPSVATRTRNMELEDQEGL